MQLVVVIVAVLGRAQRDARRAKYAGDVGKAARSGNSETAGAESALPAEPTRAVVLALAEDVRDRRRRVVSN